MTCLDQLRDALLAVGPPVYHFTAHKPPLPYIVWGEDGAGRSVNANMRRQESVTAGTVDYYTGTPEADGAALAAIEAALDMAGAWRLNSIQFEEDTGLTHYEWAFEVT